MNSTNTMGDINIDSIYHDYGIVWGGKYNSIVRSKNSFSTALKKQNECSYIKENENIIVSNSDIIESFDSVFDVYDGIIDFAILDFQRHHVAKNISHVKFLNNVYVCSRKTHENMSKSKYSTCVSFCNEGDIGEVTLIMDEIFDKKHRKCINCIKLKSTRIFAIIYSKENYISNVVKNISNIEMMEFLSIVCRLSAEKCDCYLASIYDTMAFVDVFTNVIKKYNTYAYSAIISRCEEKRKILKKIYDIPFDFYV